MVSKWLVRLVHDRIRTAVTLAALPLAIMNGLPVAAGCICADGHYEPVCKAGLCRDGKGDCDRSLGIHRSCCKGDTACCRHRAAPLKDGAGEKLVNEAPCCTPVANEAVPAVINSSQVLDVQSSSALIVAVIELPSSIASATVGHRIDFDKWPPPDDLVVTLRRLVI